MIKSCTYDIAILGTGESGMGALRLAVKQGLKVFVSEAGQISKSKKNEIEKLLVSYEEGGHDSEKILGAQEVIKSPGIPEGSIIVKEIRKANRPILSEIEFASRYTSAKIIGITGSNGKTTTTLLTTHLLKSAGLDVLSAGNIGNSFSDMLLHQNPDILVLELSSFQLDDIHEFKPDIALLLNVTPDHLDRYNHQMEEYAAAKFKIFKNMQPDDLIIYNADDQRISNAVQLKNSKKCAFSGLSNGLAAANCETDHLIFDTERAIEIIPTDELSLLGQHNLHNQMAAILVAIEMNVSFKSIMKGLKTFVSVPHRLEKVALINDVSFINDSKATNVDAVFYALDALDTEIVWIAGGVDKGNDYGQIKSLVQNKVHSLICLGKDNSTLISEFSDDVRQIEEVSSMRDAIQRAFSFSQIGETILLSPACASFDLFNNYEDRGDQFRSEVLKLQEVQSKVVKV